MPRIFNFHQSTIRIIRSLRIGLRLSIAFSMLLGLLFLLATVSLLHFEKVSTITHNIVDVQAKRVSLIHDVDQHADLAANYLLQLLKTSKSEERIPLYRQINTELTAKDEALAKIGMTMQASAENTELEQLEHLRSTYNDLFQQTLTTIELSGTDKARENFEANTLSKLEAILREAEALSDQQQLDMRDSLNKLEKAESNARILIVVLALCALLIGALLAWIIGHSIVNPIHEAVLVAEAISLGDLKRPVSSNHPDEAGKLMRALAAMRDSIANREEKILRLAYEDTLTGLPNRTRFFATFSDLPAEKFGAVVVLDIDRFTSINNALGYPTGDLILQKISLRLVKIQPVPALIARLWGDKFAFLLDCANQQTATDFVNAVLITLREPITLSEHKLDVGGALGISFYPDDGQDAAALLRRAEMAVNFAKHRHAPFAFSQDAGSEPAHENLSLIGEMREALDQHQFLVYYQPKMSFANKTICGAEALIRWQHPVRGLVPPMAFIPFAEQTGFIREITPWLLEQVITHIAAWQRRGLTIIPSANLSTFDLLDENLVTYIRALLEKHGVAPNMLCLEITESAFMNEPELALKHLNELAALGVKLSIDDYGTGQASLAYLKTLPVNELKIDRAFISSVSQLPKNAAIVRSTILLCHELALTVVAEGAETTDEINWLAKNQCDVVQGYGVAKPMPEDEFLAWSASFNQKNLG